MSGADIPVVALVGRPNVGKSALFNRVVGRNTAIVSEEAGTTRDRHFARADWAGHNFWLVDTGGIVDDPHLPMDIEIRRQVEQAITEADVLLFVVDALAGLNPSDTRIADCPFAAVEILEVPDGRACLSAAWVRITSKPASGVGPPAVDKASKRVV